MPGHSRSKNGVAPLAYVAGIHVLAFARKTWMAGTSPAMTGLLCCARPPFHIGDALRHAEFLAAHLGERRDAGADRLVRRIGEAEPHAALGIGLVGRPFGPRIDRDAGG